MNVWTSTTTPGTRRPLADLRRRALVGVLTISLAAGCTRGEAVPEGGATSATGAPSQDGTAVAKPGEPRTLVKGLSVPWAIAFLPDGDALVTERDSARLLRVTPEGAVSTVGTIDGVSPSGEGGLLGVAVSPEFPKDHYVFVYFTAVNENRIVRYRYDKTLKDPKTILDGIPAAGNHNGGRLEFGPDGYLYAATGDAGDRSLAQALGSLGGKILRMTVDGATPPESPFQNVIWSYGHRNVQGMAWDDQGRMFATEFGQNTYDEINRIERGGNYGWPTVEGAGGRDEFTDPLVTWSTADASPSGLAYAGGSLWAAGLRGTRLWQIPVGEDGGLGTPVARFDGDYGRLRAAERAPDGSLWVTTSNKDGRGSPDGDDDRILVIPTG
ncbi:PQQ-dependent sugar dehydrogenase [Sphaerisporangium rubeum]|uniref:Glucose/arabinose dehydrogenase n=1 Tax=Sphaerisporangium rubeum TaxID=321317 RepID=A0A7X0IIT0_9ACTN|nr:PQQ-dependent sugar dehydrogenase [Sphaerisporangium rubeum]MBB6475966.1 glucose/arabinose dehydrogenase [Sphaerisporangium rubeum]